MSNSKLPCTVGLGTTKAEIEAKASRHVRLEKPECDSKNAVSDESVYMDANREPLPQKQDCSEFDKFIAKHESNTIAPLDDILNRGSPSVTALYKGFYNQGQSKRDASCDQDGSRSEKRPDTHPTNMTAGMSRLPNNQPCPELHVHNMQLSDIRQDSFKQLRGEEPSPLDYMKSEVLTEEKPNNFDEVAAQTPSVCLFVCFFVCSFVRLFVCSFVHLFACNLSQQPK